MNTEQHAVALPMEQVWTIDVDAVGEMGDYTDGCIDMLL